MSKKFSRYLSRSNATSWRIQAIADVLTVAESETQKKFSASDHLNQLPSAFNFEITLMFRCKRMAAHQTGSKFSAETESIVS